MFSKDKMMDQEFVRERIAQIYPPEFQEEFFTLYQALLKDSKFEAINSFLKPDISRVLVEIDMKNKKRDRRSSGGDIPPPLY